MIDSIQGETTALYVLVSVYITGPLHILKSNALLCTLVCGTCYLYDENCELVSVCSDSCWYAVLIPRFNTWTKITGKCCVGSCPLFDTQDVLEAGCNFIWMWLVIRQLIINYNKYSRKIDPGHEQNHTGVPLVFQNGTLYM
jgi:hypothetical protein